MSHSLRGFFVCLMVLVAVTSVNGQSRVQFSGSLGLNYDTYHYSETNYSTFRPRHPANLGRFTADATLTAGRHFVLPVSIHLTTGQNTYNLPSLPDEGLVDYIRNPRNNVSINPSYRWIHGFFGSQTPMYSELTTGDIALFGVGLELDPGHFLFSINYGTSQLGVEYDPVNDIAGAYEQKIFASRIGYGRRDGTHFALNLVKATEDETSVSAASPATRPSEGLTFSPLIQIRIVSDLLFRTEFAGSVYTFDVLGPDMPYDNNVLDLIDPFLRVNASSNADWSKVTSLEWKGETLTLGGEVRYVGPGFQPAGYRFMERDLIDYKINSGIRLSNNRLTLNGSFGLRTNNLQNTTLDKTNRTIFNLNAFGQVTEAFSVQVNYANYGFRNNVTLDTLRIEMIHNTIAVSPAYQIRTDAHTHVLSGSVSYSHFDEFNLFTARFQNTTSLSTSTTYQIVFHDRPLSLGAMAMYLINDAPMSEIRIFTSGLNARYRFFNQRLIPSARFTYSRIAREPFTADHRLRFQLRTTYKITEYADFNVSWNASTYRYGSSRPDAGIFENRLQVSLQTRF